MTLEPAYQYVCGNGHYCAGPRPMSSCLRPNCTAEMRRIGTGSKGARK